MVKVAWKYINGYGPYAYLQESVREGDKVTSKHLKYLGKDVAAGQGHLKGVKADVPPKPTVGGAKIKLEPYSSQGGTQGGPSEKEIEAAATAGLLAALKTGQGVTVPTKAAPVDLADGKVLKTKVMKKAAEAVSAGQPVQLLLKPSEKKAIGAAFSSGGAKAAEKAVKQLSTDYQKLVSSSKTPGMGGAVELKLDALAFELAALTGAPSPADLQAAAQGIQESSGMSHYGDTVREIAGGEQKAPTQKKPSIKALIGQQQQELSEKDWDKDLQEISGQKGSNAGGLYKDKVTQGLYYVKWGSKHDTKGNHLRCEHLANLLYQRAGVPVPPTLLVKFGGKTALASEWVKDAEPMTIKEMAAHPTVRRFFAVDAWLANWDVVGLDTDNIVRGPASSKKGEAYRIDPGGSLLFRAQGKAKPFPTNDIPELESMRETSTAPQASQVFKRVTEAQLKTGARSVAKISDDQIDQAVDLVFPKPTPVTLDSGKSADLPTYLKKALKGRRDFLVEEVINAEPPKPLSLTELAEASALSKASVQEIVQQRDKLTTTFGSGTAKRALMKKVMDNQLGKANGKAALEALVALWTGGHGDSGWKSYTTGPAGSVLRWAAAEQRGKGERAEELLEVVWEKFGGKSKYEQLRKKIGVDAVNAIAVSRAVQTTYLKSHLANKKGEKKGTVTVYRTDRPDIVKMLGFQSAKVGETVTMKEPLIFSWSFEQIGWGLSPGAKRYRAEVPIEEVMLTDRVSNTTGNHVGEDELVFCCPVQDAEVIAVG